MARRMSVLHITNGDSTRLGLELSGVPGTFRSWGDILHDGPTPAGLSAPEWRRVRAEYLASQDYGAFDDILAQYEREDAAFDSWPSYDELVLWFEHDLYDQLILIRHLAALSNATNPQNLSNPDNPGTPTTSLVCSDRYLGPLKPHEFPALFDARQPITPEQLALGARAWDAFRAEDPRGLETIMGGDTSALPYLAGALQRHFEDYPWEPDGLARSERQILRAIDAGATRPHEIFRACAGMEERIFMGDLPFWTVVRRLASGPRPLVGLEVGPWERRLPAGAVTLTGAGRDVLAGRADYVALNGISRWMGGVPLSPSHLWRWTGSAVRPASA